MNVVVVGASSGVGRATALAFAANGCGIVAVARDDTAVRELAVECRDAGAPSATGVACDIATMGEGVELLERVRAIGRIDVWVNAAAVLTAGELPDVPADVVARSLAIDTVGTALASRAALRLFREQRAGTLINVSSLLGVMPNPVVPVYCMGKFAVRGLTIALQQSLPRRGPIRVCLVLYGPIDTPIFGRAANYTGRRLRAIPPAASPERAAATIVSCAHRPRRVVTLGATGHLLRLGSRLLPGLTSWVVARTSGPLLLTGDPAAPTEGAVPGPLPRASGLTARVGGGWRRVGLRTRAGDAVGRRLARRRRRSTPADRTTAGATRLGTPDATGTTTSPSTAAAARR